MNKCERYRSILIGTAVGDSLGLPAEGMSASKIKALGWNNNWKQRLIFGYGMLSDDTEHTILVSEGLAAHPDSIEKFRRSLARKFRWWLLALPAGVGFATARSIVKLCVGFTPSQSGVFSAGNGPAMRSAIIGAYFDDAPDKVESYVRASTEITHTDPKALVGALAIAYCAATPNNSEECWIRLKSLAVHEATEWPKILDKLEHALRQDWELNTFVAELGVKNGITGYTYHTVPSVLFTWFKHHQNPKSFEYSMAEILNAGGDTDTTGAILGALLGAKEGTSSIPKRWKSKIHDWPNNRTRLESLAQHLSGNKKYKPAFWPFHLFRNIFFLLVVLAHSFLRLVSSKLRKEENKH